MAEYTRDDKRGRGDSPKKKRSPKKKFESIVMAKGNDTWSGEEKGRKGKQLYITSIIYGSSIEINPSEGR